MGDIDSIRTKYWPFVLHVEVIEARHVEVQDLLTSDPFAVVSIGAQTIGRTKVVMRNLNPKWHAQFSCALLHCNAVLRVSLYDFDYSSSDDDMGYVEVKLSRLAIDDKEDFCLPILRNAKTLGKGTLHLSVCISRRVLPIDIQRLSVSLSTVQLPMAWYCEIVRRVMKYYHLDGTKFTGLHPALPAVLSRPEVETRELMADVDDIVSRGQGNGRRVDSYPIFIGRPIARLPLKLSCRMISFGDSVIDNESGFTQWLLPFLPLEYSAIRINTADGSDIMLNTPQRYGTWVIIRLLRCMLALKANRGHDSVHPPEDLPFVWTRNDLLRVVNGTDMISTSYNLDIGVTSSHDKSEVPHTHSMAMNPGRLSHVVERRQDGVWNTSLKLEYSSKGDHLHKNQQKLVDISDIIDVRYKCDARAAVAELRLTVLPSDFTDVNSRSRAGRSLLPKSLMSGIRYLRWKYYVVIKPRANACAVIEMGEVSDGGFLFQPDPDEIPLRVGISDEDRVVSLPQPAPADWDGRPSFRRSDSMKRSNFVRDLSDPLSSVIEHVNSGFDIFLVKGHLYASTHDHDDDPIKKNRFDAQPEVLCHAYMSYERVLSDRLGSADPSGSNRARDGIKTTQFSVHMDDLPEYHVTPLYFERSATYASYVPLNVESIKCRFTTISGKLKKTKYGGYYDEAEYLDKRKSKKSPPWNQPLVLRADDGLIWADLVRVELYSEKEDPFAYAYIPLEEFLSRSKQSISLSLISPAESLKDSMSELSGVGGCFDSDALGYLVVDIARLTPKSEGSVVLSLSCDVVPHDPGYQTGWHAECLLAGSTESHCCDVEYLSFSPGPEGLYLAAYPEDGVWWQDFSSNTSSNHKNTSENKNMEPRIAALKAHKERVMLTVEERQDMTRSYVLIPWSSVASAVTLSPTLLSVQVCVRRFFGASKSSKGDSSPTGSYHEALIDVFVLGCPAEELRLLIVERVELNTVRKYVSKAVSDLESLCSTDNPGTSCPALELNNIFGHRISESIIDKCEGVISYIDQELMKCLATYHRTSLLSVLSKSETFKDMAADSNRHLELEIESDVFQSVVRRIGRLRLYLAVLVENFNVPPTLFGVSDEMISWNVNLSASLRSENMEYVLHRLFSRLDIEQVVAKDALEAVKLVMNITGPAGDTEELVAVAAARDVHFASRRISIMSNMMRRRLLEIFVCSKLLLKNMLALNPSMWDTVLRAVCRRFAEIFITEVINCLECNFTSLGGIISKEELKIQKKRRSSNGGIGFATQPSQDTDDDDATTGVVDKQLVAVQLYDLLSVFAVNNSIIDQSIRDALLTFGFEPSPLFSLHLSDIFDVDSLMVKWSSILVVEMRAWVDSVLSQEKKKMNNPTASTRSISTSGLPWLPKQFDDGSIISFIPESTTSALYNYLEECKFDTTAMAKSFLSFGEKLEFVVKNAFAVSYIYLSSYYKNELRKCCHEWALVDDRKRMAKRYEPVRAYVAAKRLSGNRAGADYGSDDDKLAWLCSVGNDSYRAIVDNLNGAIVSRFFELTEDNLVETRVGFSQSDVEGSFDRACLSFKDNLLLAAEAIACLILRDTPTFDGNIIPAWINVTASNGVFQLTVNALRYHFQNLRSFLKPYVYGVTVVIISQKMVLLYGQFIRYLHAHVVAAPEVREKFTTKCLTQVREDIETLVSTFEYGIGIVFPAHLASDEGIRHRSKINTEVSRLEQLKTLCTYSPSSPEVMHVVDQLVSEAESLHSLAIDLSNMTEACLALHVHAMAGDKRINEMGSVPRKVASHHSNRAPRRKSLLSFFTASDETEQEVETAVLNSRNHISGFVAVDMLRRLHATDDAIAIDSPLSDESFSNVTFWHENVTSLFTVSYEMATIVHMVHENKPLIITHRLANIEQKLNDPEAGKAKLIIKNIRAIHLPNLGLSFRKAPLQLHCRLGDTELTTTTAKASKSCSWGDVLEFEVSDLNDLCRRQLSLEIFFKGTLWGNVSVGHCIFLLMGLSSSTLTVKDEVNFHHADDSVKAAIKTFDGEVVEKTYLELSMSVSMATTMSTIVSSS